MRLKSWKKIEDVWHEALTLPAPERQRFVEEACETDPTCRREVESLLSFRKRAESFLDTPALLSARGFFGFSQDELVAGTVLGQYTIRRQIGSGGMGRVYLAFDGSLKRQVAIKFLPACLEANDLAKRRLVKEAQLLAGLDHPNICAVHEVNQEGERSFIVMQFVEGETLADKIARDRLQLNEALDIAIRIVEALAVAHSNGIIHRDIKPQNVIITPRGEVKVLDFGVAKIMQSAEVDPVEVFPAVSSGSTPFARLSVTGTIIGTIPYMSPEQAGGGVVDERTDLFSLGTLLYELITGRLPFLGLTEAETLTKVINLDPPPPSQINPEVRPEIDSLISKALAKDPGARHQSAGELLEDLHSAKRVLTDNHPPEPPSIWASIVATSAALSNAVRKPLIFVPIVSLMLVIAAWSLPRVVDWLRSRPPSTDAQYWYDEGTRAFRNGAYFVAGKAFEKSISSDGDYALAHARLAQAYTELDSFDNAMTEINRAGSLVGSRVRLSGLDKLYLQAITQEVSGEFGPAIATYKSIAGDAPAAEKPHALVYLGRAYEKNEQFEAAIESYEQASQLAASDAAAFLRLGILYGRQRRFDESREAFEKAEALYHALGNLEGVAEVFYQRGFVLMNQVRMPEARSQLEEALRITDITKSRYQRVRAMFAVSSVAAAQGLAAQAQQQAIQALDLAQASGMENEATGGLIWLGNAFFRQGKYEDAEKSYKQALDLARDNKGRLNEALALLQLGSLRSQQSNPDEALSYLEQSLPFLQRGGYRMWRSQALTLLGRLHSQKGDYETALRTFNEQLQLAEQVNDPASVAFSHGEIGNVLAIQEQYTESLGHLDESYRIYKSLNVGVSRGYVSMERGGLLWQLGRYDEARAALEEAHSIAATPEGNHLELLAAVDLMKARLELSLELFKESIVQSRKSIKLAGTQYADIAVRARCALGVALARSGVQREATPWCQQALALATRAGDPRLHSCAMLALAEAFLEAGKPHEALSTALQAQQAFGRAGQQDSEWQAWLIAARAHRLLGQTAETRDCAAQAATRLAGLEEKLGAEAYNGYLARADVNNSRRKLEQVMR